MIEWYAALPIRFAPQVSDKIATRTFQVHAVLPQNLIVIYQVDDQLMFNNRS